MTDQPTSAACYQPDGSWSCIRDHVTEPCGDCDGCRLVRAENATQGSAASQLPTQGGRAFGWTSGKKHRKAPTKWWGLLLALAPCDKDQQGNSGENENDG